MQRLFYSTKLFNSFLALLLNFSLFTACSGSVGNGNGNSDASDTTSPNLTITSTEESTTANYPFPVTFTFSEDVTGFEEYDVVVTNATLGEFTPVNAFIYTANVYPSSDPADILINVSVGAAEDLSGNLSTAADEFTITYDGTAIEKPNAYNTGYRNELATIIDESTYYITDEGAILENTQVNGVVWIKANNVTIRDCLIDPGSTGFYGIRMDTGLSGITIEYCEISNVVSAIILGRGFTMRRCYCHDSTGDAFKVTSGDTETWLEWNFVEKLGTADGAHADGIQMADGGSNVTLYKNNIWMPAVGTDNYPGVPYKANACIFLGDQVIDILVDSNWLNGGGFTTYGWDGGEEATGVSFTNNRFGRDYLYNLNTGGYSEWSGNVFDNDDSEALPED